MFHALVKRSAYLVRVTVIALFVLPALLFAGGGAQAAPSARQVAAGDHANKITTRHWDSWRDFVKGRSTNLTRAAGGALRLRPSKHLPRTTYTDPFGDGSARTYEYGSWTSPVVRTGYPIAESVSSWNVRTPTGTYAETTFRGRLADGSWTKWYVMGRWSSGDDFAAGDIHRTSVDGQGDADANIYTDTFSAKTGHEPVAYQTRVKLLRPLGSKATPVLDGITTMTSESLPTDAPPTSKFTLGRHVELRVPRYSQHTHDGEYPDFGGGGEVWCSPTSSTMIQYYWAKQHRAQPVPQSELSDIVAPNGDPQVDYAAINAWDYTYGGSGNWPFNTAYTHRFGLTSFVTRLRSLAEVEKFIDAGIPVATAQSWKEGDMPEAGYWTSGHLFVIVGFTAKGDPIINDPAGHGNADVRRVYTRKNFEKVWQKATGGIVYVNVPRGGHLPDNVPGKTQNW